VTEELYPVLPILIVDDQPDSLLTLKELLHDLGYTHTLLCADSRQVEGLLGERHVSLILLDMNMPGLCGEELLPVIRAAIPEVPVMMVTVQEEIESAVRCIKQGAYDYLLKNDRLGERLRLTLPNALEISSLRLANKRLNDILSSPSLPRPERPAVFSGIVTRHPKMLTIFKYIEDICQSVETVLITGETGTGKELIAEAIHKASGRKGKFVAVNIAALDDFQFTEIGRAHV
jgi:DNA-binding NtrC family response regulator